MIDVSPNQVRTKELLAQDKDWQGECEEEYESHSKAKKELGEMLFDIFYQHYNELAGVLAISWRELPCANKVIWIRTADEFRE